MKNKTIGYLMQAPLALLGIAGFAVGIYASVKPIAGISSPIITAITFAIITVLYFLGAKYLAKK